MHYYALLGIIMYYYVLLCINMDLWSFCWNRVYPTPFGNRQGPWSTGGSRLPNLTCLTQASSSTRCVRLRAPSRWGPRRFRDLLSPRRPHGEAPPRSRSPEVHSGTSPCSLSLAGGSAPRGPLRPAFAPRIRRVRASESAFPGSRKSTP
jgi:hypothetical protein